MIRSAYHPRQLLADLGADVIKVEEVSRGDDTRSWSPPSAPLAESAPAEASHLPPESAYFLAVNRNKRSITVNFKHPDGLEILKKMIKQSDVLVENFVSGKLATMGLGWEVNTNFRPSDNLLSLKQDCKKINPRLIYTSITGYGQTGPYQQAAGYDVIIEAEAGLMHITGEPDRPPAKVGVAATDIATGLYAHGAIMAALLSRQQTGKGVWIDCNLFESQFRLLAKKILEQPELSDDPRFSTNGARVKNRDTLIQIITDVLERHTRDHWIEKFTGLGVPFGPINNIEQTFNHPQAVARGAVIEVEVSYDLCFAKNPQPAHVL
ncbi:hypothetical protein HWV62_32575 [Athelia sp. TMB]|nr:hypothetical protein HWV62_32575 [Athelia sp. TMB]